ncbi:hypothetical protein DFH09DRAFT_1079587 [Mycena vulgaris]|nr:hypothetical protein DFH09DRAFT_1079587 [Mycena vulgaris]
MVHHIAVQPAGTTGVLWLPCYLYWLGVTQPEIFGVSEGKKGKDGKEQNHSFISINKTVNDDTTLNEFVVSILVPSGIWPWGIILALSNELQIIPEGVPVHSESVSQSLKGSTTFLGLPLKPVRFTRIG